MGVVRDYKRFKKYNITSILGKVTASNQPKKNEKKSKDEPSEKVPAVNNSDDLAKEEKLNESEKVKEKDEEKEEKDKGKEIQADASSNKGDVIEDQRKNED